MTETMRAIHSRFHERATTRRRSRVPMALSRAESAATVGVIVITHAPSRSRRSDWVSSVGANSCSNQSAPRATRNATKDAPSASPMARTLRFRSRSTTTMIGRIRVSRPSMILIGTSRIPRTVWANTDWTSSVTPIVVPWA